MNWFRRFVITFGHLGSVPIAPGTFGTLGGVALAWFLRGVEPYLAAVLVTAAVLYAVGRTFGPWTEQNLGKDPGCFVIDEVVGFLITIAWVKPPSLLALCVGFALFRLFDILKPWPIRRFERLPGGDGIMMDDVVAGLFALAVLSVLRAVYPGVDADIWSFVPGRLEINS